MTTRNLEKLMEKIETAEPGYYELSEIFGNQWEKVRRKTLAGIFFKRMVLAGQIPCVNFITTKSNQHALYKISKKT